MPGDIALIIFAYLLGSIPTGVILARLSGVNLREVGSGNIGATNVTRAMGKAAGTITLMGDVLKGFIPVLIAKRYFSGADAYEILIAATGVAAILGHIYSVFLRFNGGKGVATALGALLGIIPVTALTAIACWLFVFALFRISSLSAIIAFLSMPFSTYLFYTSRNYFYLSLLIPAVILYTHRENIARLLRGEEKGFTKKSG